MEEAKSNSFFTSLDSETADALEQDILPQIISQARLTDRVVRIWLACWQTPELPMQLSLLLVRLLGQTLSHYRVKIFVTIQDEERLLQIRHGHCSREVLAHFSDEELARFCQPDGEGYRLLTDLRRLLIFGRHDPLHDPLFANLDLIVCGLSLHSLPEANQQQFLAGLGTSLKPSGYFVCQQADATLVASFPFVPLREGLPLYQPANSDQSSEPRLLTEDKSLPERNMSAASYLHHLLQMSSRTSELEVSRPTSPAPKRSDGHIPFDVLLQLAPTGIVVLNHRYQILTLNRAAQKLITPQISEEKHRDFFHATSGLPYQEVRTAIDTVMREGIGQSLPEVELTVSSGGNGRVLSIEICSMPTEIGHPPLVILYIWDVTMQTVHKKMQLQQAQTIQELRTANDDLKTQYRNMEHTHEHLLEVSQQLLLDYQQLVHQLEEAQEERRKLDEQVEQLLEEITVLTERSDQ